MIGKRNVDDDDDDGDLNLNNVVSSSKKCYISANKKKIVKHAISILDKHFLQHFPTKKTCDEHVEFQVKTSPHSGLQRSSTLYCINVNYCKQREKTFEKTKRVELRQELLFFSREPFRTNWESIKNIRQNRETFY